MIKEKKSSLLLIGAAGLLIAGGVAAYWTLTQRQKLPGLPVGANIIPQDAVISVSVSTSKQQWEQLRELGTPQTAALLDRSLTDWRDRLLTNNGYNYEQDIQPWVGDEITIAFLPTPNAKTPADAPANSPPAALIQSTVVVLPIANPAAAQKVLTLKPLKEGKWSDRTYKGIAIKETQSPQNYSAAVLDKRFLIVTDNPKATERAIDSFAGAPSLAQTPGYTQSFSKIETKEPFAQVYVNIPAAAKVATSNPARSVSPQSLAQLGQTQGVATTMSLETEGISFKGISWLKLNSEKTLIVENKAGRMASRLPPETLIMLSGDNLQRLWQDYVSLAQSNSLMPIPPENIRSGVKSLAGLDLDQDLLSWMGGEYSLSVVPAAPKEGSPNDFALSLVFMVETSDSASGKAEKSLQQIEKAIGSQYQFQVKQELVKGQPTINWIAPYGTVTATRGWLDKDVTFLSLGAPVADRIVGKPVATLASTQQFQKTVPTQLNPNSGQLFVDVERSLQAFPLPELSPEQQTLMEAMRSIGATTAVSDERSIRYDVFVALKKSGSAPLPNPERSAP